MIEGGITEGGGVLESGVLLAVHFFLLFAEGIGVKEDSDFKELGKCVAIQMWGGRCLAFGQRPDKMEGHRFADH